MAILFVLSCLTAMVYSAHSTFEATNSVYLDNRKAVLFRWAYTEDAIKFKVTMPTTGWIGIGFSPTGGMKDADIIFAWMKNGQPRVLDMHADTEGPPDLDAEQNFREYSLTQNGTHSTLFIHRYLDTCDEPDDFVITEDTTRVIFAYSDSVPAGDLPTFRNYHGSHRRDIRSIRLLDKKLPVLRAEDQNDFKYFDVRIKPYEILPTKTYYHCSYHKLPEFDQKQHAVQFEILKTPGTEKNLHHFLVYHCNESLVTEEMFNTTFECYNGAGKNHWKYCVPVVVAWAVGMTEITFPDHVGYPLGTADSPKIVKFEIHYDNPEKKSGLVDYSGIRIYHTSKLRQYDAGVMMAGHDVGFGMYVPPRSKDFIVHGHCSSQCLSGILDNGGVSTINVFGVFMHSHTAGRKLVLRHYRNETELKPLAKDLTYDFDFQETKLLAKEATIRSGDNLIMECVYDTSGRDFLTEGGLSTEDEMCLGFVMYYPKINDAYCISSPTRDYMLQYFGADNVYYSLFLAMMKKWTNYSTQEFNQVQLSSPNWDACVVLGAEIQGLQQPYNIPTVKQIYIEENGRCEAEKVQEMSDRSHVVRKRSEDREIEIKLDRWMDATAAGYIVRISTPMFSAATAVTFYFVSKYLC